MKPKLKQRSPWETINISQKRASLHEAAKLKDQNPTPERINNFKLIQSSFVKLYENERNDYIENKIEEIQNAATNKKSALAWKTVNEISGRQKTNKAKLKAKNEKERIDLWHNHFKDLLGCPISNQTSTEYHPTEYDQLDITTGNFTSEELIKATKSIQNGKATGIDEIPVEVWKLYECQEFLLESCNKVYWQEPIEIWTQGCLLPFPKKGDLSVTKKYRGITLTPIAAKIYNLMLLNRITTEIDPILRTNQNGFRKNRSTTGQILTIRRILEGIKDNNLPLTLLFIDFSKAFDTINREMMKIDLIKYGLPSETVNAIIILYKNTRSMVRSPDGDTSFFEITTGVLQGDTLAPFLFII